jgi:hypothetical protein
VIATTYRTITWAAEIWCTGSIDEATGARSALGFGTVTLKVAKSAAVEAFSCGRCFPVCEWSTSTAATSEVRAIHADGCDFIVFILADVGRVVGVDIVIFDFLIIQF